MGNFWGDGISGYDGIYGRSLICYLVYVLVNYYWKFVILVDVLVKYVYRDKVFDYLIDVDSLFFIFDLIVV